MQTQLKSMVFKFLTEYSVYPTDVLHKITCKET